MGLFMSEFPTQGPPEVESLRRFIPEQELFPPDGPVWEWHGKDNEIWHEKIGMTSHQALLAMIDGMMGEPRSIEEFTEWGGVLQGEFLQAQIGYYRRRQLGGAMFWMLADAWPSTGFSIIDYYLRPKPAYYFVRRAFLPLSLVFGLEHDRIIAWAINNRAHPVEGEATIAFISDGKPDPHATELPVTIPANGVVQIWSSTPPADPARQWVTGTLQVRGEVAARAAYFFALFKEIRFAEAKL
jgi:beta-mannosidase